MEPFRYDKTIPPVVAEKDIPPFDSWWDKKISPHDKWSKYLRELELQAERENIQDKIDNKELNLYEVEVSVLESETYRVVADTAKEAEQHIIDEYYSFGRYDEVETWQVN